MARTVTPSRKSHRRRAEASTAPGARLLVEEVGDEFIYTLVDRASGAVILRLPRDQLARLADHKDYASGSVLDTEA